MSLFKDSSGAVWPNIWPSPDTVGRFIFQKRLGTDYWTKLFTYSEITRDSILTVNDTITTDTSEYYQYKVDLLYRMKFSTRTNHLGTFTMLTPKAGEIDSLAPRIDLAVNGERYVKGAYVPMTPQMYFYLSDPSGINRSQNHFYIVLDGDTIPYSDIAWTDPLETAGDQIALIRPHLALGDHEITAYAQDNLGNDTIYTTDFKVEGTFGIDFALNYPNPFSEQTKVVYVLTSLTDEYVKVKIYTVSGRLIRTLRETERAVINYRTLTWDGRDEKGNVVANGVYFGRIIASREGKKVEKTIKMAKVR